MWGGEKRAGDGGPRRRAHGSEKDGKVKMIFEVIAAPASASLGWVEYILMDETRGSFVPRPGHPQRDVR